MKHALLKHVIIGLNIGGAGATFQLHYKRGRLQCTVTCPSTETAALLRVLMHHGVIGLVDNTDDPHANWQEDYLELSLMSDDIVLCAAYVRELLVPHFGDGVRKTRYIYRIEGPDDQEVEIEEEPDSNRVVVILANAKEPQVDAWWNAVLPSGLTQSIGYRDDMQRPVVELTAESSANRLNAYGKLASLHAKQPIEP